MCKKCLYDDIGDFSEGLARVCREGKYGFVDKTGREVVSCQYDDAGDFCEGLARVEVHVPSDDCADDDWIDRILGGKNGYIDKTGTVVIPCKFDQAYTFHEGLARVRQNGKYVFIDKTGTEVFTIEDGSDPDDFSDGLSRVNRDGKTGFIDKTGRVAIPCKFDGAHAFSEGMAVICEEHLLPEDKRNDDVDSFSTRNTALSTNPASR